MYLLYLVYGLALLLWGVAMLPVSLFRALRGGKPVPGLRQSLGFLPACLRFDGRPTIWFHSCSVGETLSVGPLAHDLSERFPGSRFVFSTVTHTGQAIARDRFQAYGAPNTFYFPFDLTPIVRRVFDWIQPAMLVIVDVEIWPNVVREARRRKVPVVLCNGRIPADAFRGYLLARPFLARVLSGYDLLMMKSREDAERIVRMGAPPEKVVVTGNVKCDRDLIERDIRRIHADGLVRAFGLDGATGPLIVAGCTHAPEESILLQVLRRLRGQPGLERLRLLVAPRHPERFAEVAQLVRREGFTLRQRTDPGPPPNGANVLLLDSLGELPAAYQFASVAFVGGTLIPHGGQSILEPACYAKPTVIGPSMESFPQIIDDFLARDAVVQIRAKSSDRAAQITQLTEALGRLLREGAEAESLGARAASVLEASRGASAVTVARLAAIYETRAPTASASAG